MTFKKPLRCPCCQHDTGRSSIKMLHIKQPGLLYCDYCYNYSALKPGSQNTWYCSNSLTTIREMMKEDGHEI